ERTSAPVAESHTFSVLSWLAQTMRLPSGLYATQLTPPACPLSVRISWPLSASHTFTSPALFWLIPALALMMRLPSGLNATLLTGYVCPVREKTSALLSASHTFSV